MTDVYRNPITIDKRTKLLFKSIIKLDTNFMILKIAEKNAIKIKIVDNKNNLKLVEQYPWLLNTQSYMDE